MRRRKNVHVLFTGGTISMRIDASRRGAVPALSARQIVARVRGLSRAARLTLEDFDRRPGPHVTPAWIWRLRRRVAALQDQRGLDGIVVTHGTDTLEETAFLLDLTLSCALPVVFCGAMRTLSEPGWDGPANLTAAVRAAAHPASRGRGVLVAFAGEIHAAAEVTKWHTLQPAAFRSPGGPVGSVERDTVRYRQPPVPRRLIPARRLESRVELLVMAVGSDAAGVHGALERGTRGIVVEATGCGNVPPRVVPGLRAALRAGVPVVVVSRCPEGRVSPTYAYEGGGRRLLEMGAIFAPELPGHKARIKLMAALGHTRDLEAIRTLFREGG